MELKVERAVGAGGRSETWVRSDAVYGWRPWLAAALVLLAGPLLAATGDSSEEGLAGLVERVRAVEIEEHSAQEYRAAVAAYRAVLTDLEALLLAGDPEEVEAGDEEAERLEGDERLDAELLARHLKTRLFEIEDLRLHEVVPVRYFALSTTDSLFTRPCAQPDRVVREARDELERLPRILANATRNLTRPARAWTENAMYTAYYAQRLVDGLDTVCVDDPALREELLAAGAVARQAIDRYAAWLESDLLPRSDRSPAWRSEEIEFYQFNHEGLDDYGVAEMLRVAEEDERATRAAMEELAGRIHPSGDLETVWELMKEEAPPWPEVQPMAERYVELADDWLRGAGSHLLDIPPRFDYGVVETTPMGRRVLSFGGATYGPSLAGRISGYYVLTPLEERLSEAERRSRLKSYNPYWTHVISYHEWVGHNVQRAIAEAHPATPVRRMFRSSYLSQAWSFYLEKLLEDEGYFEDVLPHVEALKTRMARLQMRMWRVQRILTKLRMARGEMTFDQAVRAYVDRIGMEPGNAFIEVQRDSQSPSPPGREIIGERVILELRDEYRRRFGEHYRIKDFHEALLRYGELPLPTIRRLMFGDY